MGGSRIGVLGFGALASVDGHGAISADGCTVDWLVGADDGWHVPSAESAAYQQRPVAAPIFETAVRAPGGEVAHTAYAANAGAAAGVVVEIENRSAAPLTVGLVVRFARAGAVTFAASALRIDGAPVLAVSRPPGAWAAGDGSAAIAMAGDADRGPVAVDGPTELTLLFPVPHRTTLRAAFGDFCADADGERVDVRALPDAAAVARGWDRQLERGLQAELPSPVGDFVGAARADLLLAPPSPETFAALEAWGFDDEAARAWAHLGLRDRRRTRRATPAGDLWAAVRAADPAAEPASFLIALRAALVREAGNDVELLPGFPPEWLGQSLTVDALPLRAGPLAFAVRWHGARPALLWDAPAGVALRAPALDPDWSTPGGAGETLLAEPPQSLLPMGSGERSAGEAVDAPGQFT